jgi:type I restriction enzyme M protein
MSSCSRSRASAYDDLTPPDVIAAEIVENLEAALKAFKDVAAGLPGAKAG